MKRVILQFLGAFAMELRLSSSVIAFRVDLCRLCIFSRFGVVTCFAKLCICYSQDKTETAPTIVEELFEYGKYEIERPFKKRLTDGKMLKQLKAWGAKKERLRQNKEAEDAGKAKVRKLAYASHKMITYNSPFDYFMLVVNRLADCRVKGSGRDCVAFAHYFLRDSRLMVAKTNAFNVFFVANRDYTCSLNWCSQTPASK